MKRVWPGPWSVSKGYLWVVLLDALMFLPVWAKVILPLVSKARGRPKWLPSILERYTIGWQSCVIYAAVCQPSVTRNAWNRRNRDKKLHKKSKSWDKWRHPDYPDQRSPRSHKEWNAIQHLPSSPASECKLVHFLNLSGSSQLCFWVSLCSIRWTVISFFSHNLCNVMVLMLTILSYISFALIVKL